MQTVFEIKGEKPKAPESVTSFWLEANTDGSITLRVSNPFVCTNFAYSILRFKPGMKTRFYTGNSPDLGLPVSDGGVLKTEIEGETPPPPVAVGLDKFRSPGFSVFG